MGRSDWNGETFAVLISEYDVIAEVRLYNTGNGGTIGDAWGEFIAPDDYKDKQYFTSGEWIYFSKNLATTVDSYVKGNFI